MGYSLKFLAKLGMLPMSHISRSLIVPIIIGLALITPVSGCTSGNQVNPAKARVTIKKEAGLSETIDAHARSWFVEPTDDQKQKRFHIHIVKFRKDLSQIYQVGFSVPGNAVPEKGSFDITQDEAGFTASYLRLDLKTSIPVISVIATAGTLSIAESSESHVKGSFHFQGKSMDGSMFQVDGNFHAVPDKANVDPKSLD